MSSLLRAVVLLALCTAALCARAHETWLLAREAVIATPAPISIAISSGMAFPKPDTALPAERLARAGVRLAGERGSIDAVGEAFGALIGRAQLRRPGLATLWMEIPPQPIELTAAQVEEYFDEIQADPAIRAAWDPRAGRPWRERYAKFATAMIRVGPESVRDESWAEPLGGTLEIIPETDPTALGADPTFTVRVLKSGRPLAGLPIGAQKDGVRDWTRTDETGRARFKLVGRGPWLIHATELMPPTEVEAEWTSWFTTLTIARQP